MSPIGEENQESGLVKVKEGLASSITCNKVRTE